jgi:DNA polymerase alpha subunit A
LRRYIKGLDIVRRDWSGLAKAVGNTALELILSGRAVEDVVDDIHGSLRKCVVDLVAGRALNLSTSQLNLSRV